LVEERGALTLDQLLYAFAVAQVTPGQANVYVASLGYMLHGLGGALLAVLVMVLPGYTMLPLVPGHESLRHAPVVRRLGRRLASDLVDLPGLGLVERAGADQGVDLVGAELADLGGRPRHREQFARHRQRRLVAGADRDDAGDQDLEQRAVPLRRQLEQGRLGV